MANRKQRHHHTAVAQQHTQAEINKRLHRAHALSKAMYFESISCDGVLPSALSATLSYVADDLRDIQQLVNGRVR